MWQHVSPQVMPLAKHMTLQQVQDYLKNDLRVSVVNDVGPCVQPNRMAGGYFAVPRLVLGYVDFLGALYHGYLGRKKGNRRVFADQTYAKAFLRDVFGLVDVQYNAHGELLWEIYRNGTVHLYQPLALENANRVINWSLYKGPKSSNVFVQGVGIGKFVTHLEPTWIAMNHWIQPVSITCLYDDLLQAIDTYIGLISRNRSLLARFRQVADALQVPESTLLSW